MKLIIQKIRDFLLRKKRKGRQLIFFEKIGDKNTSRDEMLKNLITVLEKNGFKIKNTTSGYNVSGNTYIYMAFAESPFVNSNGVPTNAR